MNKINFDSKENIDKLSSYKRCEFLNSNAVFATQHFQYRVQLFCKGILLDVPLSKISYYMDRVELQVRGSPHIHSFLWMTSAPKLNPDTEEEYMNISLRIFCKVA